MYHLFVLSGENIPLAKGEIISLLKPSKYGLEGNLLLAEVNHSKLFERLALTKKSYRLLFTATRKDLLKKASSYPWQRIYKKSFSVRGPEEKAIASHIWRKVKNPKVDLKSASTKIEIIGNKNLYCCLLIHSQESFSSRKPHLRPGFAPVSLSPKLARALVNLTGSKTSIMDPFCGTGGILIEAALMGLRAEGSDTSREMLEKAKRNLTHYRINCKLSLKDALKIKKHPYIVADLPYGRNTRLDSSLYRSFLLTLDKALLKKAVLTFPKPVKRSLLKGTTLKIESSFTHYIHSSLTKHIVVLTK
ncbi:methyltransferase domain-containing protein [Candidatus Woesearchaeota archaeon]|nr:methyltransferase domain-containing protein [Candidatus Woesearchaeota archaeon]